MASLQPLAADAPAQLATVTKDLTSVKAAAARQLGEMQGVISAHQRNLKELQQAKAVADEGAVRARTELATERVKAKKLQVWISLVAAQCVTPASHTDNAVE